ncbi:Hypothetical predicted protein [Paramuricea clavata]|uniref:Uncharacterized protein n=1 Tax=Paramuricea clavata TaxID=317549 RepID=A0A6S7FTP1_PARCT|nr:Hypothetical predicted protein [Paramuricea clavata]
MSSQTSGSGASWHLFCSLLDDGGEPEIVVVSEIEENPSHPEASNHESQVEALPGCIDEPEHCSGNNIILDTTLATIESDKASMFSNHSCNNDYPSSDEECTIDCSCIHHYVSNDEVSTISEHSSIHEYITIDKASVDFTDVSVNVIDNSSTPTFQKQLNQYERNNKFLSLKDFIKASKSYQIKRSIKERNSVAGKVPQGIHIIFLKKATHVPNL